MSTGINIAPSSDLTVGTTAVTSGTDGRVFFQAGGVIQQDAAFFWDNTNKRLGVGATPSTSVRLDVRAQGALSTDIAFRVRNSANTFDLFSQSGDGGFIFRNNNNTAFWNGLYSGGMQFFGNSHVLQIIPGPFARIESNGNGIGMYVSSHTAIQYNNGNFQLEETTGILQTSGRGCFSMKNASVIPSTSTVDRFILYSADIIAGNAAPHFRTENGAIVKVYQETTAVGASTLVGGGGTTLTDTDIFDGYTLKQIVKALRNQGLLA